MTAMQEIVAGLVTIGAAILGVFVEVTEVPSNSESCGIGSTYNATLTSYGEELVDQLAQLISSGVNTLTQLVAVLTTA